MLTPWIVFLILLALLFDFLNGFHDAANSIATIVSTRVLSPRLAVWWAAFFNFAAILIFKTHVADTIGKGIIDPLIVDSYIIFATLTASCAWNIITWFLGLPTSSSHALIGGLIGAALVKVGYGGLVVSGILKVVAFIVISPLLGFILASIVGFIVSWAFRNSNPFRVDNRFRKGQLISAALYSLGHGGNDAQKTMGIVTILLFSCGFLQGEFHVPWPVIIMCYTAIALGTLSGGWRIVKTMGQKIARLKPMEGFCAETGAAISIFIASGMGVPVSTTHTITGGIVGAAALKRKSAVRWGVAGRIVWAWIFTIPAAAFISAGTYYITALILGL